MKFFFIYFWQGSIYVAFGKARLTLSAFTLHLRHSMHVCQHVFRGFLWAAFSHIKLITSAAFFCLLLLQSVLQLLELRFFTGNSALLSLAFYGVCMGGHPAIPLASLYFLCVILLSFYLGYAPDKTINIKKTFLFLCVSAVLFLLLASPMLYSYGSIWKLYNRNSTQQSFDIINTGFGLSSLISFLFPFTTTAHSGLFNNDVAMRNIYFSLPAVNKFVLCGYHQEKVSIFF